MINFTQDVLIHNKKLMLNKQQKPKIKYTQIKPIKKENQIKIDEAFNLLFEETLKKGK